MPLATYVHIVSRNKCTKFPYNIYNVFFSYGPWLKFLHDYYDYDVNNMDAQAMTIAQLFFFEETDKLKIACE